MKTRKRTKMVILLSIGLLLAGCSQKQEDTVSLPVLEISESEKLPYSKWEDVPCPDGLAAELQRVATEMESEPIETLTYLRYSDNQCMLTFDYKEFLAYGQFVFDGEKWIALYIADARSAETFWVTSEHEDLLPPYVKRSKDTETHSDESTNSMDAELESMQREAEELAAKSKNIENGDFYDSVISIFSDAEITAFPDGSVSILLNIKHTSVDEDCIRLFEIAENICNNCNIENEYSDVSFFMRTDVSVIGTLNLLDYESPISFTSTLFVLDSEYESTMKSYYEDSPLCRDAIDKFNDALNDIAEKYNQ